MHMSRTPLDAQAGAPADAQAIVKGAVDYLRDSSSYGDVTVTVHRPQWERKMRVEVWTRGQSETLLRINEPAKDRGTSLLRKGDELWTYAPKVNRSIKLPPSMLEQAWMGSDFSNNDLSKAETLVRDYRHSYIGSDRVDGHQIHIIEAQPLPGAPVVWGKQVLRIRDDRLVLQQSFFDERGRQVKEMRATGIQMMSGKLYPQTWTMTKADSSEQYTTLYYHQATFGRAIRDSFFSLANLSSSPQ
jgi:outer membrane lipoprotein-sorting protein